MKKLLILVLLCCLGAFARSQVTVRGMAIRSNMTDTLKGVLVSIYPDTGTTPPFTLKADTTDQLGRYMFVLPALPINTKFYVSTLDCDSVTQKVNTIIYTGSNNIVSDLIVCVTPSTTFGGYVYLGSSAKRPIPQDAYVYMLKKCPGNIFTYVDTVQTDTNGYFKIDSFPSLAGGCEVMMKAALKNSSGEYKKYFPAYHNGSTSYSLKWSGALTVPLSTAKAGVEILLPAAVNPTGGPSSVSGYAIDVATNNKLENKVLFLTDMNDVPVDFTYTDVNGNFTISNLPFGTYKLFGDVLAKNNPDFIVKLDADHVNLPWVVFREYPDKFEGSVAASVTDANGRAYQLSLYPNPADDFVHIHGAEKVPGNKTVVVTDMSGHLVYTSAYADGASISISLTRFAQGIYSIQLQSENGSVNFKLVK